MDGVGSCTMELVAIVPLDYDIDCCESSEDQLNPRSHKVCVLLLFYFLN